MGSNVLSRFLRALVISTWIYSLLGWLYVVARVLVNNIDPRDPFILEYPDIAFFEVGIVCFLVSFVCFVIYLAIWGSRPEKRTMPESR